MQVLGSFLLVLVVWLTTTPLVMATEPVRLGFLLFPGYSELDAEHRPVGSMVSTLELIVTTAGYSFHSQVLPVARLRRGLRSGQIDIWPGLLEGSDLEPFVIESDEHLGLVGINLYHRPGQAPPLWPDSLRGRQVILVTNFAYTDALLRTLNNPALNIRLHRSSSHTGALQMLMMGRGDYLLNYRSQVIPASRRLGIEPPPNILVTERPLRLVISRERDDYLELRERLDAAIAELRAAGVNLDQTMR
ncbi:substrate-binding periplasmic protein [Halopseudomonas salegens]|uniref:Polar amino acid transport system substrate-binding protein n=1 Tax=Halopseudomonas salegens TaxID=1434072 RepID=A0A1H2EFT1_9GAMM|nr:transporter substrate-binding domain-containing protein [Halopseudomonas salegens]SDT93853.1 polar amino acid transport system substrate-binding protein [Halopseudomonas salegens]